jgi:tetratricopeptide (TPR) repeat protein
LLNVSVFVLSGLLIAGGPTPNDDSEEGPPGAETGAEPKPRASEEVVVPAPRRKPETWLVGWREYRSAHFLVDSDLSESDTGDVIRQLEMFRSRLLGGLLSGAAELPGRVRVLLSDRPATLEDLATDHYFRASAPGCAVMDRGCRQLTASAPIAADPHLGFLGRSDQGDSDTNVYWLAATGSFFVSTIGEPTIVLPAQRGVLPFQSSKVNSEVVVHELAHYFAAMLFLRTPPWFVEGFASFVQTLGGGTLTREPSTGSHIVRGERSIRAAIGLAPPAFQLAVQLDSVPLRDLFKWQGEETQSRYGRFHVQSWLLYHWLWNRRSKQLSQLQEQLSSGADPARAWSAVFPEFDPAKPGHLEAADDALNDHRISLGGNYYRPTGDGDARFESSSLLPADVHLLLVDGRYSVAPPSDNSAPDWLRSELLNIAFEDPSQPVAIDWRSRIDGNSALAALRRSVTQRPTDWRAWLLLGDALPSGEEKIAAYQKAVALNPDSDLAQRRLAFDLATTGNPAEAIPFARQAIAMVPWDPHGLAVLSVVDAALGQCVEATEVRDRALRFTVRGAEEVPELREVEKHCPVPRGGD